MVLENLAGLIIGFIGLEGSTAEAATFFLYNSSKIMLMLTAVVFAVGYLRTFLPPQRIRDYLQNRHWATGYIMAAGLGIVSPFCSCSTIPIFIGLIGAGVPFGMTMTFLAVSPMVNQAALLILPGIVGLQFTLIYAAAGVSIGIATGLALKKAGLEKYVEDFEFNNSSNPPSNRNRIDEASKEAKNLVKEITPYVLLGVGVGAVIHGYIPEETIENYLTGQTGVIAAVIAGIPIYTNILGVIPVVESLTGKGLPTGTALAFMMSVAALSIPQFMILKKAMKKELIAAYAASIATGILFIGFLFNAAV